MNDNNEIEPNILNRIQSEVRHQIKDQILNDRLLTDFSQRIIPVTLVFDWMKGDLVPAEAQKKVIPGALCLTLLVDWEKNLIFFEADTWVNLEEILERAPLTLRQRSALMGIYSLNGSELEVEEREKSFGLLGGHSKNPIGGALRRILGLSLLVCLVNIGCAEEFNSRTFKKGMGSDVGSIEGLIPGEEESKKNEPVEVRDRGDVGYHRDPPADPPAESPVPGPSPFPTSPPGEEPVPVVCPGKKEEDFPLSKVRLHFYTGKKNGGGTNMGVMISPQGKEGGKNSVAIGWDDSSSSGKTEPGSLDTATLSYLDTLQPVTSLAFSKIHINLFDTESVSEDPWFLGALLVEGLKKGCADEARNWIPLYFNPFLRTWILKTEPLKVSDDDAVAIFEADVGNTFSASSGSPTIRAATPFETRDPALYPSKIRETPPLDYEDTQDFQKGRKYLYGRTYFAEEQPPGPTSRLKGRFSEFNPEDFSGVFKVLSENPDSGVYFDDFVALLIRANIKMVPNVLFQAYSGRKYDFWLGLSSVFWGSFHQEETLPAYYKDVTDLGESISDQSPLAYLKWAIQYDNPGDD